MTVQINLYSHKGGSGTSTIAAMSALVLARTEPTALLTTDADTHALIGVPHDGEDGGYTTVTQNLTIALNRAVLANESFVRDWGTIGVDDDLLGDVTPSYLVMRGPCYLALRKAAMSNHRPDGIVLLAEPGRSLGESEVRDVTGLPVVASFPYDPAVSRIIDAGLLSTRIPKMAERPAIALVDHAKRLAPRERLGIGSFPQVSA